MRTLLALFLILPLTVQGQAIWRNFFVTNQNPRVTVVAGSNATVQASLVGVDQRIFTVNAIPGGTVNTNDLNGWISTNVAGFAGYATNAGNAANSTNFWGVLAPTNLPPGLTTSNYAGTFTGNGAGLTNLSQGAYTGTITNAINSAGYILSSNVYWSGRELLRNLDAKASAIEYNRRLSLGYTNLVITAIGDSLTANEATVANLRINIQNKLGNAGAGWIPAASIATAMQYMPAGSAKGTNGVWTDVWPTNAAGCVSAYTVDQATPATLSVTSSVSQFVIHYQTLPGGGSLRYRIDGGAWTTNSTAAASVAPAFITNNLPAWGQTNHWIQVGLAELNAGVGILLSGVDCQQTNSYAARVHNLGFSGSTASNWITPDASTWETGFAALRPDVAIIMFGVNEAINGVTPAAYGSNVITLVNRIKTAVPLCDVLLVSPPDIAPGTTYSMSQYAETLQLVAMTNRLAYFDCYRLLGDYTTANSRGLYANAYHPSLGGRIMAYWISDFLLRPMDNYPSVIFSGNITNQNPYSTAWLQTDYARVAYNLSAGNNLDAQGYITSQTGFSGNSFVVNQGAQGFTFEAGKRIRFGGTTAAYPALTRAGGDLLLTDGAGTGTTNSLIVPATVIATNGFVLPAIDTIPTNKIPVSSAAYTNWVLMNWTNTGPVFVATNTAAAGSFLLRQITTTLSAWP